MNYGMVNLSGDVGGGIGPAPKGNVIGLFARM